MGYPWIDSYCLQKKGVVKDYKEEWEATRYCIGGKMFAMQGNNKEGKPIFTIKLPPALGDLLRRQYTEVTPGYYMNKVHWNSLLLEGQVPDDIVQDMIDQGYTVVFNSLSKRSQAEILGQ